MRDRTRVALIGCGSWGRNLLRELAAHPCVHVALVVDSSVEARHHARRLVPHARLAATVDALTSVPLDAVVVATPGPLHASHARIAVDRGLHVLVEKPMAMSVAEASALVAAAERRGIVGMVGHLLRYHAAVRAMIDLVRGGSLGPLRRFQSARLCTAGSRDVDGSLLWSLAPHDVSVLRALDASEVVSAVATEPGDGTPAADLRVELESGLRARVSLSRVHPAKVRRMVAICDGGQVTFDDVEPVDKVRVVRGGRERSVLVDGSREPLAVEVDAFVRCVRDGVRPRTGFAEGLDVVRVLEAAQRGLEGSSARAPLAAAR